MSMDLIPYQLVRYFSLGLAIASILVTIFLLRHMRKKSEKWARLHLIEAEAVFLIIALIIGIFSGVAYSGFLSAPQFVKTVGPGTGPQLPLMSSMNFFSKLSSFKKIENIGINPNQVPAPINRNSSTIIQVNIEAREVVAEIFNGTTYNYWTYNEQVPGPFIRARVGDTINVTFSNHISSIHIHSIDFHAVNGPGGGAEVLQAKPGETKTFKFKVLNPGLYVYHCASAPSAAAHMTHGQYGLILIEPEQGLQKVDREFYVMQGELYTMGNVGDKGLQAFDADAMLNGNPNYVIFNGKVGGLANMTAKVDDNVRIFVGNGGVNLISSFHVIGEIFDTVYPEASIGGALLHNVQTTIVPAGGAAIVEFEINEPGKYVLVDHALARVEKGAYGALTVTGAYTEEYYSPNPSTVVAKDSIH